jgi:hypothetical protein
MWPIFRLILARELAVSPTDACVLAQVGQPQGRAGAPLRIIIFARRRIGYYAIAILLFMISAFVAAALIRYPGVRNQLISTLCALPNCLRAQV